MDKRVIQVDMWALDDLFGVERHPTQYVYDEVEWNVKPIPMAGGGRPLGSKDLKKRKRRKGNTYNDKVSRPITINGVRYKSQSAAARALGMPRSSFLKKYV